MKIAEADVLHMELEKARNMTRLNASGPTGQSDPREERERILIVSEGEEWFIRHIYFIEHKLDFKRTVYHCDRNLAGPFLSVEDAVSACDQILHGEHSAGLRTA